MTIHPIYHSVGLAVIDQDPGHNELSFVVGVDGDVRELTGWGYAGPPVDTGHFTNAPPNPFAVHTVLVEGDGQAVRSGLRELIAEHLAKYSECRVWTGTGMSRDLANWVRGGCVGDLDVPTDEELADAARTEVPVADDSFFDVSEPVGEPVSYEVAEDEAKAGIAAKVEAAKAEHEKKQLQGALDDLGVSYDGRWGVTRLQGELDEALAADEPVTEDEDSD